MMSLPNDNKILHVTNNKSKFAINQVLLHIFDWIAQEENINKLFSPQMYLISDTFLLNPLIQCLQMLINVGMMFQSIPQC